MDRSLVVVVLVVMAAVSPWAVAGAEEVSGSPGVTVSLPSDSVVAGETTNLAVQLTNRGRIDTVEDLPLDLVQSNIPRITTASGVTVEVSADEDDPITVETGEQAIGSIPDGATRVANVTVTVDDDASPGTYRLPITYRYRYTESITLESDGDLEYDTRTRVRVRSLEVTVEDRARFRIVNATADLRLGQTGTVDLTMENVGTDPARDATVTLTSQNADVSFGAATTASRYVGTWQDGETRTISFAVSAAETARVQRYAFDAVTRFETSDGKRVGSESLALGVMPQAGRQFRVTETSSAVSVGDTGSVTLTMVNDGPPVRDASIRLQSQSNVVRVGGASASSHYVGSWDRGETRTTTFDVAATDQAEPQSYLLEAAVAYDTADGAPSSSRPVAIGLTPSAKLDFAIQDLASTLYVGEDGTITGTVVNRGERTAHDVEVVLAATTERIRLSEPVYPIDRLEPGDSATFEFDAAVTRTADPGPRSFTATIRYEDASGDRIDSDPIQLTRDVGAERDWVELDPINATFDVDSDNRLVVEITNVGPQPLTDVNARFGPSPPFTSEGPQAYVAELEPGASATLAFQLTVGEDAVESTHAIAINVTADRPDDETIRTGPHQVPVSIATTAGPGSDVTTLALAAVVVLLLLAAGWWWLRQ